MNKIPVHRLEDRTHLGFQLKACTEKDLDYKQSESLGAHRDDHYIFFIMLKGSGTTIVDFEEKTIRAHQLYYILPEQIHYRIRTVRASGWFIAADPSLVDPACRNVFESWLGFHEPVTLTREDTADYDQLLSLLYRKMSRGAEEGAGLHVLHALLRSFFEMAASTVRAAGELAAIGSRPAELAMNFKHLLNQHMRKYKRPSDYAHMLHVSESYLNESLKRITGSSVSFWIHYKIVTEAKRLLYYSDLNVKQIASELGFDNHAYFSRFFCKETGMSALTFRKRFREAGGGRVVK